MTNPGSPFDAPRSNSEDLNGPPSLENRNLAVIAHLSGCLGILGFGLVGFVGPLLIYLLKKDTAPFVESQAKEALNFQITLLLLWVVCVVIGTFSCGFLIMLVIVPVALQLIFGFIAAMSVRDGVAYRYPFNLRLLQ